MAGIAAEVPPKIALNWAMIKIAPEPEKAVMAKPAMENINLVLVIRAINTPAPVRATRVVPAPPAAENIRLVLVNHPILGVAVLVNARQLTNTPAPVRATPAALAPPAAENIPPAPVPAAMNGKTEVARNKFSTVPKVICIIVTVQWLVLRLAIWASMLR